jgi:lysophospholipase L1-like esterase
MRKTAVAAAGALVAVLVACSPAAADAGAEPRDPAARATPAPLRAVFFGSSTTEGSGASRPDRRWTSILSSGLGWIEVNRGLSGSTLTDLRGSVPSGEERWREAVAGEPADLVLVMYGTNDALARVPLGDPETPGTFRHAAAAVVRGIRAALPDATVVVLTPQPNRATAATREPYDAALAEAAAAAGAVFLPAGSAFAEERLADLSADALHLNDAGHAALATFLLERRSLFAARRRER